MMNLSININLLGPTYWGQLTEINFLGLRCFVFLIAVASLGPVGFTAERPNIVLIMADDLGYSDIGCYGGEIETPNLDRLASSGVRMTQFYNTAKCHTSRASLLTGLHWQQAMEQNRYQLSDAGRTIPEVLREAGYTTAMVGKWHLSGSGVSDQAPLRRGFDRFFGTIKGAGSFFAPLSLQRNATPIEPPAGFYYTDAISAEAVAEIQLAAKADKPLFLYISYTAPHWPLHALPEDIAKYRGVYRAGWDVIREERFAQMKKLGIIPKDQVLSPRETSNQWCTIPNRTWQERRMEVYAAMVDRMDQGIGRVLRALEKTGKLDNTLLIFLSDNGACAVDVQGDLAAKCLGNRLVTRAGGPITIGPIPGVMPGSESTFQSYGLDWANVSNTPYRKFKSTSFEGGIRTPCILHWPNGMERAGCIDPTVAHLIDIMPTCVQAAGTDSPVDFHGTGTPHLEGISLTQLLRHEDTASRTLYQQFRGGAAMRQGRWKIVTTNYQSNDWALYDMQKDGAELQNLAAEHTETQTSLIQQWRQWAKSVNARQ